MNYLKSKINVRKRLTSGWESVANSFDIDVSEFTVSKAVGDKKDTFTFIVPNNDNELYRTFHSGDGSTTVFTLKFRPPSEYLGDDEKLSVLVDDVGQEYVTSGPSSGQYTVSGTTLTFGVAPASGTKNIEVRFKVIDVDDLVRVYRYKNTGSEVASDILEEGFISDVRGSSNVGTRSLSFKGESLINLIFKTLVFVPADENETASLDRSDRIIQWVIQTINSYSDDGSGTRKIYGESAAEWTNIGNDVGSSTIRYTSPYRPAYEIIEDLSSSEHTGNGQYYYYLTYNTTEDRYEFIYKAKDPTSTSTIEEGNYPITNVKPLRSDDEVINFAIYNCGVDGYGNGLEFPYFDFTQGAGKGGRWKYITKTNNIADNLVNEEFNDGNQSSWDTYTGTDGVAHRQSFFPKSAAFPYTFTTVENRDSGTHLPDGTFPTVNDEGEFNDIIWEECKWRGWSVTKQIIDLHNDARKKVTLTVAYGSESSNLLLGNVYKLKLPSFGLYGSDGTGQKLRLVQIDYHQQDTEYFFEEDEQIIGT